MPEPFIKEVLGGGDREEGTYAEAEDEEDVPKVFSEVEDGREVEHKTEDAG